MVRGDAIVLDSLSLRIAAGQHTAILGANGSGKSSLVKLINRELYPLAREGESPVRVLGRDRWNVQDLRRRLGVVSGDLGRDLQEMPGLEVEELVLTGFSASLALPSGEEVTPAMRAQAAAALAQVEATALAGRLVAEISTGEMRRVLIARALVHRPQALLLDEPSAGLDLVAQQVLLRLLGTLARQGITLVLVTHHLEEIIPAIGRVILLQAGRVLADGDPASVLTTPNLSAAYGGEVRVRQEAGRYLAYGQ